MDKEKMKETLNEELSGSIDFDVVDVSEGQIIRLKDGTLIDPEIFISYFNDLSAFEEEFGPLEEAKEKLRDLKKLEEEFGPVSEISEALNKLYEKAEALLESYHDEDGEDEDYYLDDEEEEDEEELDVSDLTVKQLLALLVTALLDDDEGADEDVDLEDLDLENIGDMTVGELLRLLREGKVEEVFAPSEDREDEVEEVFEDFENKKMKGRSRKVKKFRYPSRSRRSENFSVGESVEKVSENKEKEGCGCGGNKSKSSSIEEAIEKLFEEGEEGGIAVQPPMGIVEEPNKDMDDEEDKEKEREKEEKEEQEDQENVVKVKEESFTKENAAGQDPFDLDIFKRLLDRLG
jgi:hypothetical protein